VLELQKDTEWSLGKKLKIDELEFNEIDQIIAEYIEPITNKIKILVEHRKFQRKNLHEMCKCHIILVEYVEDQAHTLRTSAYGFIMIPERPGTFYLVYKHPLNSRKYEYIMIKPAGYLFRKKVFGKIDDLLDNFKRTEAEKAQIARQAQQIQRTQGQGPPRSVENHMHQDRAQKVRGHVVQHRSLPGGLPMPVRQQQPPVGQRGYPPRY
jgi:transcription elongation factor SPT6